MSKKTRHILCLLRRLNERHRESPRTRARGLPGARVTGGEVVSLQMAEHGFGYFLRSFAMREMTNAIEEQASVAAREEAVQSLR